ncbi:hypothetical protein, partial [Salmonella enterica]|uniref:hypothetical protein n=1 Tax=Salmonella enterica TaxID=28901 RepID=UPI0022B5F2DB
IHFVTGRTAGHTLHSRKHQRAFEFDKKFTLRAKNVNGLLRGDAGKWVWQVDRVDPFAASLGLESSHI